MRKVIQKRKNLTEKAKTDPVAAVKLAQSFGFETPKNFRQETNWYSRAVEMGSMEAQNLLGECYRDGHGVTRNPKLGNKLLLKAAKRGEANAQVSIGYDLFYGEHFRQDRSKAIYWYRKAAAQGQVNALSNLGLSYHSGKGVKKNYCEALKWFRKAAAQDHVRSMFWIGHSYWWAQGVKKNVRKAFEWFWKAAWYGDAEANTYVGMCFHDGVVVKKNFKKALKHYRLASKEDSFAQCCLGQCYRDGDGIKKSRRLAIIWLRKAITNGEKQATKELGILYKK